MDRVAPFLVPQAGLLSLTRLRHPGNLATRRAQRCGPILYEAPEREVRRAKSGTPLVRPPACPSKTARRRIDRPHYRPSACPGPTAPFPPRSEVAAGAVLTGDWLGFAAGLRTGEGLT